MGKYIDADELKVELDRYYQKYQSKYMETRNPYTRGLIDALDLAEQSIDSLQQEQPEVDLEKEISTWIPAHISGGDNEVWKDTKNVVTEWAGIVARHFAKWGAEHLKK